METPNTTTSSDSGQSWKKAKTVAEKLGYVPSSFSIAVRTLLLDQTQNNSCLRPVTKYQAARLLKTPTFKAMLYHASVHLRGHFMEDKDYLSIGTLMDLYEPYDIAALIASFVYYRKAKSLLNKIDCWDLVRESLSQDAHIGAQVGVAIPALGIANGLISGTMLQVGTSALILEDQKAFREYRRHLKNENLLYDFAKESELFGCSSQQVGVFTLSKMGFGVDVGEAFSVSLDKERKIPSIKDPLQLKMKLARMWTDTFKRGDDKPMDRIPGEYYPLEDLRIKLQEKLKEILDNESLWLEVGKDDASQENAPKLYRQTAEEVSDDIPEELSEVFSMDEITAMEEESFDELVDQMDAEQDGKVPAGSMILKEKDLEALEDMVS